MFANFRLFVAVVLFSVAAVAQSQAPTLQDANALLAQSKYSEAAAALQTLTAADATSGPAWFGLGQAFEGLNQPAKAIDAYKKSLDLHYAPKMSAIFSARAYASKGEHDQAYSMLAKLSGEPNPPNQLILQTLSSPAFASMKDEPRIKELQEKLKPCSSPEYRQFDFWLGSWEVFDPQGNKVGHNNVTSIQAGCLILENWTSSRSAQTGTSFNFYDNRDKKWHQIYYDNSGNFGNYPPITGELKDGKMVLVTLPDQNPLSRWTWYVMSPGKVKQMSEQSTDGGKTWTTTWDSVYVK